MSEISRDLDISAEKEKVGPDYFGFYASEVADLLHQQEDFPSFVPQASHAGPRYGLADGKIIRKNSNNIEENNDKSGSVDLFVDCLKTRVSELVKDRLRSLLRQSVVSLSHEVDEMVDPVFSIYQIQAARRSKGSMQNATNMTCVTDNDQPPLKRTKTSMPSSDIETEKLDINSAVKEMPKDVVEKCKFCYGSEDLCDACGTPQEQKSKSQPANSGVGAEKKNTDGNEDLQFLLENDSLEVDSILKKYSEELLTTIKHMETMLDKLLDAVMTNCRPMSRIEKRELQKLIQNLPGSNIGRIVEIIKRTRPVGKFSSDEIHVDLEKEDKETLWRLYYYVQTVKITRSATNLTDK